MIRNHLLRLLRHYLPRNGQNIMDGNTSNSASCFKIHGTTKSLDRRHENFAIFTDGWNCPESSDTALNIPLFPVLLQMIMDLQSIRTIIVALLEIVLTNEMFRNHLLRLLRHYLLQNGQNTMDANTSNSASLLQKFMELLKAWIAAMRILRFLLVDGIVQNLLIRIMKVYLPLEGECATTVLQMFIDFLTTSTSAVISLQIILSNEIFQELLLFLIDCWNGQHVSNSPTNTMIMSILQMLINLLTVWTVAMTYLQIMLANENVRKLLPVLVELYLPQSGERV
ncbi:hypothetical protein HNY73_012821 [Argiope bruennichi]|uniref:Uncharacterized protein n=1 Tax=Argiope bruennichi TaxID=94029 RepID=A0A8T0F1Z7_ARGBR|nr:hypothetical protein HNY73_012821 [Argiope bruennichi]